MDEGFGLKRPTRWMWNHRPGTRQRRRFSRWLAEADRRDNARLRLVMASVLGSASNCLDVGANEGDFLYDMVRLAPFGRHIGYEPLPYLAQALVSRFPTVDIRNCAVSNQEGTSSFAYVSNGAGWSGLRRYEYDFNAKVEELTVRVVRLDDDLPADYSPNLILVDVNGGEVELFEGAIRTLTKARPIVLFEHGMAVRSYGHELGDVYPVLADECHLRIYDLDGSGPLSRDQLVDAIQGQGKWNFMARP